MSEQDFKHAATDVKNAQVEATREIAEMIAEFIQDVLRERSGEKVEKPKVEIYSSSEKVHPPRSGKELTPDQVDDLLNKLANEEGSVRVYVEHNGKREKIFHQTQGEIKADPLGLKEAMSAKLGPKLEARQQAKADQQNKTEQKIEDKGPELRGGDALKAVYQNNPDWFKQNFPATTRAIENPEPSHPIDPRSSAVNYDALFQGSKEDRSLDFVSVAKADNVSIPPSIDKLNDREVELRSGLTDAREQLHGALYEGGSVEQVQSALESVADYNDQLQANQQELKQEVANFNHQVSESPALAREYTGFIEVQQQINPDSIQSNSQSVSQQDTADLGVSNTESVQPSYEQSPDTPSLDHAESLSNDVGRALETIDSAPAPIPEKAQEIVNNAPAVYEGAQEANVSQAQSQPPAETVEQGGDRQVTQDSSEPIDSVRYPEDAQPASAVDPAFQAAKAEFDRKLGEFQNNLDHFQNQLHKLSEQVAPLMKDPKLQSWTKAGSELHRKAMQPIRDQLSTARQTVYERLKNVGQKIDNLGRKATDKLSELQAKAIDKSVTWLVNSRYGQDTGRGGRVFEGENQTFKKIGNNVIISRNSDKAEVYNSGGYTKSANTQDKKAISALPTKVGNLRQRLSQQQNQSKAQSQPQQRSSGRSR